ncbi:barwin-like endoglucanase [Serendipita vermifera]|nr:barwin-like endoglucanase [Serendipita vermifera]
MLAKFLIAPLFIAAGVSAHPAQPPTLARRADVSLSQWQSGNYESFWRFKNRYTALGCANQKDTDFYNNCCYPLGASDSLSSRPAECTPSSSSCEAPSPTVSTTTTDTETYTDSGYDDDDDYDESNLPYCVEGQGEYDDAPTYSPDSYTPPADTYTPPADTYTPPADDYTPPAADPTPDNSSNNNNNNSGSTGGDEQTGGFATYFYQNGNPGACGNWNSDSALIAAMEVSRYGPTNVASPLCGRSVHIVNTNNGRSVDVIVADACPTCVNGNSIDLSEGAFKAIADLGEGMVPISWHFN